MYADSSGCSDTFGRTSPELARALEDETDKMRGRLANSMSDMNNFFRILDDLLKTYSQPDLEEWSELIEHVGAIKSAIGHNSDLFDAFLHQKSELLSCLADMSDLERGNEELRRGVAQLNDDGPGPGPNVEAWVAGPASFLAAPPSASSFARGSAVAHPGAWSGSTPSVQGGLAASAACHWAPPAACALETGPFTYAPEPPPPMHEPQQRQDVLPPGVTTLMIQNIPARCSTEDLLEIWPSNGSYDLLYLPFSKKQRRPSGYAFVNFTSHEAAVVFRKRWQGASLDESKGSKRKRLNMFASADQGFEENVRRCAAAVIVHDKYLPVIFLGSTRVDFRALVALRGEEMKTDGTGPAAMPSAAEPPGQRGSCASTLSAPSVTAAGRQGINRHYGCGGSLASGQGLASRVGLFGEV